MNFRNKKRIISWIMTFCMALGVFYGVTPQANTLQAAPLIKVDGNNKDQAWKDAISLGEGHAAQPTAGDSNNLTSLGDLYFTNDEENLYFWIDTNIPNWGPAGMWVNLALQVEGASEKSASSATGNQFTFASGKEPNYQLAMQIETDNVGRSILTTGVTTDSAFYIADTSDSSQAILNIKGKRDTGIEGSIKLDALELSVGSKVTPMVVLSGNTPHQHGAFNTIPAASGNILAATWNESAAPNEQSVYGETYTLTKPEESQLDVVINANGTVTITRKADTATLYLMGNLTDWDSGKAMTNNGDGTFSYTTPKKITAGSYEFKFRPNAGNWDGELSGDILLVPGLIMGDQIVSLGESFDLPQKVAYLDDLGERSQVAVTYSLSEPLANVTLSDRTLTVDDSFTGSTVGLKVISDKDEISVPVNVIGSVYTYKVNYYRTAGDYAKWNLWANDLAMQLDFEETVIGECIQQTIRSSEPTFDIMVRKGLWEEKDVDSTRTLQIASSQKAVEVWLVQGNPEVFYVKPDFDKESSVQKRYVVFEYIRPAGDYDDWNVWTWFTGVTDGQADFVEIKDGKAIAYIEVGPTTENMGFKLRKGDDWNSTPPPLIDYDFDRLVPTRLGQVITKVRVTQDTPEMVTLLPATMPQFDIPNKQIQFTYRDNKLFKLGQMTDITSVTVEVNNKEYAMHYDENNEMFTYNYQGLEPGSYKYCYKVTYKDGTTATLLDPMNKQTEEGKSVVTYSKMDIEVSGNIEPKAVNFRNSGIITIDAKGVREDVGKEVKIEKITVDLTALGGKKDVVVDKDLKTFTLVVTHDTTAGVKQIPIKVYDASSNIYEGTASVEVLPQTAVAKDHFDWDEAVIYFMLTDRFYNGDTSNDDPAGNNYNKDDRGAYQGGDLKGVTEKLDYLKALGINTIWISPVVDNIDFNVLAYNNNYGNRPEVGNDVSYYGYHGYWAKNFEKLNPHFGTLEDFHKLIDTAHDKDIKIMVDVVINHTGYGLQVEDTATKMGGPADLKNYPTIEDKARFEGMLRTDGSTDAVYGELDPGLSDFITEDPEVRNKVIKWQTDWVEHLGKTAKGNTIDYFRVDTAKHVDPGTYAAFKTELTKVKPNFKMIAEAWFNGAELDAFLARGSSDSVLNFDFKEIAKEFVNGEVEKAEENLGKLNAKATSAATYGNFLGSHDEGGFLHDLGMENTDKLKLAATLQATSKGQPVIYYGEELGQSGPNNWPYQDNRYHYNWSGANENNDILTHYRKIFTIRNTYSELFARGTRTKVAGSDSEGYIAFERAYAGDKTIVAVNSQKQNKEITLKVPYVAGTSVKDEYSGKEYVVSSANTVSMVLPASTEGGTAILTGQEPTTGGGSSGGSSGSSGGGGGGAPQVTEGKVITLDPKAVEGLSVVNNTVTFKANATEKIIGVSLPSESVEKLFANGTTLQIVVGDATLSLPPNAIDSTLLAQTKEIIIKIVPLGTAKQEGLKENNFNLIGNGYDITVEVVKEDGTKTIITQFEKGIRFKLALTDEQRKSIKDKRKAGVYYIPTTGTPEFLGGKYVDGGMEVLLYHLSQYAIIEYNKTFSDLNLTPWAKDAIEVLAARQITSGKTANTFDPKGNVTRAELVVFLGKSLGIEPKENTGKFTDVQGESWYSGYVMELNGLGLINGYTDGTFRPNQKITRQEMAVLVTGAYAYAQDITLEKTPGYLEASFQDLPQVAPWATPSVKAAKAIGLIKGNHNKFSPHQTATRAEIAVLLMELLEKTGQF